MRPLLVLVVDCFQDVRQVVTHLVHFVGDFERFLLPLAFTEHLHVDFNFEVLDVVRDLDAGAAVEILALLYNLF